MTRRVSLRPAGFDELGLRRALAGRMLPFLVAAMAFLAALGLAGWVGAAALARQWQGGAGTALTVQVPHPDEGSRLARVLAAIQASPGIERARALSQAELAALLRPWLGTAADTPALPLPGVIAVRLGDPDLDTAPLARDLAALAPGTLVESHEIWVGRLAVLARSLQACAGAALVVLAAIAAAVIAVATRAGLAARREAIEIVHGLGASDGYIAGRFAARTTALAAIGALAGAIAATPALLVLAHLAAPFVAPLTDAEPTEMTVRTLPPALWMLLPGLPLVAASIGFLTAQATVRRWLRRLP
ncbi:MAG: FtsX-like permease family protein [Acetobacteraceae bacterium]